MSPVPSVVAAGVTGFHGLHREGLSHVSLGRGAGGFSGEAGAGTEPVAQIAFYRENSPSGRAKRARKARGHGGKMRGEGSLPSLRQCLQDGVHFLSHSRQCELKLVLGDQRRGHEGPRQPSPGCCGDSGQDRIPSLGSTLVCTMPGRWSRMCSSVAAMSISFTPGAEGEKGIKRVAVGRAHPPSPL